MNNNSDIKNNERNSSIDIVRIVAIFLICIYHSGRTLSSLLLPESNTISWYLATIINSFGTIGNLLFVIISSYFLVNSPEIKLNKVIRILIDSAIISIIFLVCYLISGINLDGKIIIKMVFPDFFGVLWFIPCYLVFYLLSPIIIYGLKHVSKKYHLLIVVLSLCVYSVLVFLSIDSFGSSLVQFFQVLIFVAYIRWYCNGIRAKNSILLLIFLSSMILFFTCHVLISAMSVKYTFFRTIYFASIANPLLIIGLSSIVFLASKNQLHSRLISYFASCSLYVYIIHENYLFAHYSRGEIFKFLMYRCGLENYIFNILIVGLLLFVGGDRVINCLQRNCWKSYKANIKCLVFLDC